ncbi:hypothetical protein HID58_093361 [Brassica napus]|uniref:Uncharacterized protein n=1 Tax=Brassica napus TaxID=3708 RepID=A0ABQ7XBA9_BRANA|nr:hypothetical protein HID58_093361 [Brassica napus]
MEQIRFRDVVRTIAVVFLLVNIAEQATAVSIDDADCYGLCTPHCDQTCKGLGYTDMAMKSAYISSKSPDTVMQVADLGLDICFTHSSVLSDLDHVCLLLTQTGLGSTYMSYRHLKAPFNCNFPTNDVDVVGHMKLLNGQMLIQRPVLHEVATATTQRVLIHLQTK